jgi:hypothetical protein
MKLVVADSFVIKPVKQIHDSSQTDDKTWLSDPSHNQYRGGRETDISAGTLGYTAGHNTGVGRPLDGQETRYISIEEK